MWKERTSPSFLTLQTLADSCKWWLPCHSISNPPLFPVRRRLRIQALPRNGSVHFLPFLLSSRGSNLLLDINAIETYMLFSFTTKFPSSSSKTGRGDTWILKKPSFFCRDIISLELSECDMKELTQILGFLILSYSFLIPARENKEFLTWGKDLIWPNHRIPWPPKHFRPSKQDLRVLLHNPGCRNCHVVALYVPTRMDNFQDGRSWERIEFMNFEDLLEHVGYGNFFLSYTD